jgi:hypothetical protein
VVALRSRRNGRIVCESVPPPLTAAPRRPSGVPKPGRNVTCGPCAYSEEPGLPRDSRPRHVAHSVVRSVQREHWRSEDD